MQPGTLGTPGFSLRIQDILRGTQIALLQGSMGTHSFQLWVPHESSPSLAVGAHRTSNVLSTLLARLGKATCGSQLPGPFCQRSMRLSTNTSVACAVP